MPPLDSATETLVSHSQDAPSSITLVAAVISLLWYITVTTVCALGYVQIFRYYSSPPDYISPNDAGAGPEVTIIRPVKGVEPYLYDCLASTCRQYYPKWKIHIRLCISSRSDPAVPTLERIVEDFGNDYDVQILVEEEDELLQTAQLQLGPNPKIRNMSRAYREADRDHGGIVWIVDCNVWIGMHTLGRMVAALHGYKFVHQLPLTVDTTDFIAPGERHGRKGGWFSTGGTRLDEMFMSTMHPKFYAAINTVAVAPAVVGKSTMFPTAYLDALTEGQGIDYFSYNICEDHLIGDLLWKQKLPEERSGMKLGKHALCWGDLAIQPIANMSVVEYWRRRIRWLRVRKFTVTLATLVEPGTEPFICSAYGAFALTTLPFFRDHLAIPQTWTAFWLLWLLSVSIWCYMDWNLYRKLQYGASVWTSSEVHTPDFVRPTADRKRPFHIWVLAWLGRESLALPIWVWAFWGGTEVDWRGRKFWVGMDMKVHEVMSEVKKERQEINGHVGKTRPD